MRRPSGDHAGHCGLPSDFGNAVSACAPEPSALTSQTCSSPDGSCRVAAITRSSGDHARLNQPQVLSLSAFASEPSAFATTRREAVHAPTAKTMRAPSCESEVFLATCVTWTRTSPDLRPMERNDSVSPFITLYVTRAP